MIGRSNLFFLATASLFLDLTLLPPSYAMENQEKDSPRLIPSGRPFISEEKVKEIYNFYQKLYDKAIDETLNLRTALEIIVTEKQELSPDKALEGYTVAMCTADTLWYWRSQALARAYAYRGENAKKPEEAIKYYEQSVSCILEYFFQCAEFQSITDSHQYNFYLHQAKLSQLLGQYYGQLSKLHTNVPEPFSRNLQDAISAYRNVERFYPELIILSQKLDINNININLNLIRFNLFSLHLSLIPLQKVSHKKSDLMREAKRLMESFRDDRDLYSSAQRSLQVQVFAGEQARLTSAAENPNLGPRTRQKFYEKANEYKAETHQKLKDLHKDATGSVPLLPKIEDLYNNIRLIDKKDPVAYAQSVAQHVKQLEGVIAEELHLDFSDTQALENIYLNLIHYLGDGILNITFPPYCLLFAQTGDIEGALTRLEILRKLQVKKSGVANFMVRQIIAWVKVLKGDYEDWLSLEREIELKKANKKANKQVKHQEKMRGIKEELDQQKEQQASQQAEKEKNAEPKLKPAKTSSSQGQESFDMDSFSNGHVKSMEEEKKEKLERHRMAEQLRAELGIPDLSLGRVPDESPRSAEPFAEKNLEDLASSISLEELYDLRGVALRVEQEILINTWNIEREELKSYFEAMNCTHTFGNGGSHNKIKLPKSIHIMHNDEIMMILLDAGEGGGALTLPDWDQGYIPNYLKPQVLAAREKLRLIKLKALEAEGEELLLKKKKKL